MTQLDIRIVNLSNNPLPKYETTGAAGMDICAMLSEPVIIKPLQRVLIPTGLHIAIPEGYEAQIRPRSGLAIKKGLSVLNSPGTIDSDYRGEIKVILINLSNETVVINTGERIAQMVVTPYVKSQWSEVDELEDTDRGSGGFGHTGV